MMRLLIWLLRPNSQWALNCWRNTYLNGDGLSSPSCSWWPTLSQKRTLSAKGSEWQTGGMRGADVWDVCYWGREATKPFFLDTSVYLEEVDQTEQPFTLVRIPHIVHTAGLLRWPRQLPCCKCKGSKSCDRPLVVIRFMREDSLKLEQRHLLHPLCLINSIMWPLLFLILSLLYAVLKLTCKQVMVILRTSIKHTEPHSNSRSSVLGNNFSVVVVPCDPFKLRITLSKINKERRTKSTMKPEKSASYSVHLYSVLSDLIKKPTLFYGKEDSEVWGLKKTMSLLTSV